MSGLWTWSYEDDTGAPVDAENAAVGGFPSQADAEGWLGEIWPLLLDDGVSQVTLRHGDHVVYGPMSLHSMP